MRVMSEPPGFRFRCQASAHFWRQSGWMAQKNLQMRTEIKQHSAIQSLNPPPLSLQVVDNIAMGARSIRSDEHVFMGAQAPGAQAHVLMETESPPFGADSWPYSAAVCQLAKDSCKVASMPSSCRQLEDKLSSQRKTCELPKVSRQNVLC
jgi:hypothetical protein